MIAIVDRPIDVAALLAQAEAGESGGLVLFLGTVRDRTGGRRVLRLEYEAFHDMAVLELEDVARQAAQRFEIQGVDIVHRIGVLGLGETAVAIVVRAAHRQAAFDACRFAIDTLKQTVPIWKKEVFEDGEEWANHP